ncbi:MAG: hypothetical protein K0R64_3005 [Novosphingobium lindaniclasticum]|jgi:hypothetical protein|uniref:hypothetical protein n=1 Tax=Novosphingobium lindaniclasticum TaxID=1329895 RepID=UPI002409E295|nr:hypothetical protein [Novosphingobium lindaniclasticum]MDF2640021.1 hypothetical protein [Novosphingobium lindaniclasticum]
MNQTGMIVAVISVIGSLILVSSGSRFRSMPMGKMVKLALIWTAIIVGLVLIIRVSGFQIRQ